jgi:hypothetical protein
MLLEIQAFWNINAVPMGKYFRTFRIIAMPSFSGSSSPPPSGSLTLECEGTRSSEASGIIYPMTHSNIPYDKNSHLVKSHTPAYSVQDSDLQGLPRSVLHDSKVIDEVLALLGCSAALTGGSLVPSFRYTYLYHL